MTIDLPVQLREISPFGLEATWAGAAWEPRPQGCGEQSVHTREIFQRENHTLCFPPKTGRERERIREQSLRFPVAASNLIVIPFGMFQALRVKLRRHLGQVT